VSLQDLTAAPAGDLARWSKRAGAAPGRFERHAITCAPALSDHARLAQRTGVPVEALPSRRHRGLADLAAVRARPAPRRLARAKTPSGLPRRLPALPAHSTYGASTCGPTTARWLDSLLPVYTCAYAALGARGRS
jgi:hypothetical protein